MAARPQAEGFRDDSRVPVDWRAMHETHDAEALFARYRRTREPACLGEVFDLCADDLFAVALHLSRDRAAAEDLVQATFLAAMERAERWDAARALRPWLLGILHREAKVARRRARRTIDAARVATANEPTPAQRTLAAETLRAVANAIPEMPQPYRDVVELHLVQTLSPAAIAERLQRSAGTVRTQLWRGLALLRGLLPAGLAVGVGSSLQAQVPLAAVRARVLDTATGKSAAAVGGGALVLAGSLLKNELAIACGALLAVTAAVAWLLAPRAGADVAPPAASGVVAATAPVGDAGGGAPGSGTAPERLDAGAPAPSDAPVAAERAPRQPVDLPVVVVDTRGDAVVDAVVTVFEPKRYTDTKGATQVSSRRGSDEPRTRLVTDGLGRSRVLVDGPCLVCAEHARLGWSGDVMLNPDKQRLPEELRLVLLPTATVRGRVLAVDGGPAFGAVVNCSYWSRDGERRELPEVRCDAEGRFAMRVIADTEHSVLATQDRRWTERVRILSVQAGAEHEVELRFPGAFSVRGVLLDTNGQPARGRVVLLGPAPDHASVAEAKCDAAGRFEMLLAAGGELELAGGIDGATAAHQHLVLTRERPHATATLRVTPLAEVTGRVVDDAARPIAGARVQLSAASAQDPVYRLRNEVQSATPIVTSAADGSFAVLAPTGYRCTVWTWSLPGSHEFWSVGPEFEAPARDVVLVVREVDKQGFVVVTRAVRASDGTPVRAFRLERVEHGSGGGSSSDFAGNTDDGVVRVGPIRPGKRVSFVFEAEGFARTTVGPFDATVRTEEITARLAKCGAVRCVVLRADGTPAPRAWASLQQDPHDLFDRAWQGETDREGRIEFRDVPPGRHFVYAQGVRGTSEATIVEIAVASEQTHDVQVVLPR